MEENRKRTGEEGDGGEVAGKRARTPVMSDESGSEDGEMMGWLCIDEEAVSELAKLLETEVTSPVKVRFIDDPYSSALVFQSSSSYITINGNEESCGSSFSDSESSVMASIDMGGINIGFLRPAEGCGWGLDGSAALGEAAAAEEGGEGFEARGTDACDCCDLDDETLARFLGEELF